MKKYVLSLAAALLTLGFTACEDVPAPYEINGEETESNTILSETFRARLVTSRPFAPLATSLGTAALAVHKLPRM